MTDPVSVLGPKPPVTIPEQACLGEALAKMLDRGVGAVLITDASKQLVGIITERDFLEKVAGQPDFEHCAAAEFMTRDPETVQDGDTLAFAIRKMSVGNYRHMPIVADGVPTGVFSVRDLLRHVTRLCSAAV